MKVCFRRSLAIRVLLAALLFLLPASDWCAAQTSPAEAARQARAAKAQADAARRAQRLDEHQFREVKEVTFPRVFSPVWYRPQKLSSSVKGVLLSKEYEASGELLLEKDALTFKSDKETLRITYAQTQAVEYKVFPTQRKEYTYPLDWALVSFQGTDNSTLIAMFRDGRSSGKGEDTDLIFGSIAWAADASREAREAKLPLLERMERKLERVEAVGSDGVPPETLKLVEEMASQIDAYLAEHPDDSKAVILSVRLDRMRQLAELVVTEGPKAEEQLEQSKKKDREKIDRLQGRLDRVLQSELSNADAYYWKARLYGMRHPAIREGKYLKLPFDLAQAIKQCRHAVELAPQNVRYREALAQYLILDGKHDDAAEVMRPVANGEHPISLLLADRKAVPIPAGAIFLLEASESTAERQMANGHIQDYPMLRVQSYVLRVPASEVLAFYQKRWPGFQFFEFSKEKDEDLEIRTSMQLLRGPSDALLPAKSKHEVPASEPSPEGPTLILIEFRRRSAEAAKEYLSVPVGDIYCVLTVINGRMPRTK